MNNHENIILRREIQGLIPALQTQFGDQTTVQLCDIASYCSINNLTSTPPTVYEELGSKMAEIIKAGLVD
ncbi:hypothetical protein FRC08_015482, partial [Ceratobasidium sp. 394]